MKKIGIWLDKEKAHIVSLENGNEFVKTIPSEVESFRIHGGSGTRFKGGPQDVVQDSRYLEREKHQLKVYFKHVALEIRNAEAITIFGPAETYQKFNKELQENYKEISAKVKAVNRANSMTENQLKALVRDSFDKH